MGRQVRMRLLPDDLAELETTLRERKAAFVGYFHPTAEMVVWPTLDYQENPEAVVWLVREDELDKVRVRHVPTQGYWVVDHNGSSVVELAKGGLSEDGEPTYGRLWFEVDWLDREQQVLVPYPGEFVDWAQGILDWVRRRFTRDKETGDYWGPQARQWRAATGSS